MTNPVIVMGMHRSGTTLLSKILSDFGIFMGNKTSKNRESLFFVDLNDWILNQLGGRWDDPPEMGYLFSDRETYKSTIEYINQCISGPKFVKYLGLRNYVFKSKKGFGDKVLWGWKDPRNVYTLPIWLEIFPNANVIYIERNGIDVANSLKTRSQFNKISNINKFRKNKWIYTLGLKKLKLSNSMICCNLEESFSLWEMYIKEGKKNISIMDKSKVLKIRYEELLENSIPELNRIINFIGVRVSDDIKHYLSDEMNKERAYAYKKDPELRSFAIKANN